MIVSWLGGPQYTTYGFKVQRNAIIHNGVVLAKHQIIKRIRKDIKARLYLKRKFKKFGLNSIIVVIGGLSLGSFGLSVFMEFCSCVAIFCLEFLLLVRFRDKGNFPVWLNLSLVVCCWLFFVCGLFTLDLCISFVSE